MPDIVISDTSCLIIFDRIERLDILQKVYGAIHITPEIAEEFGASLPEWGQIEEVRDKKYQKFLETQVDQGEVSVIALSVEKENSLLILDDLRARKLANQLELEFTGSLGIINKAKEKGIIQKIKPLTDKLKRTDFRIADRVINYLLKRNNE